MSEALERALDSCRHWPVILGNLKACIDIVAISEGDTSSCRDAFSEMFATLHSRRREHAGEILRSHDLLTSTFPEVIAVRGRVFSNPASAACGVSWDFLSQIWTAVDGAEHAPIDCERFSRELRADPLAWVAVLNAAERFFAGGWWTVEAEELMKVQIEVTLVSLRKACIPGSHESSGATQSETYGEQELLRIPSRLAKAEKRWGDAWQQLTLLIDDHQQSGGAVLSGPFGDVDQKARYARPEITEKTTYRRRRDAFAAWCPERPENANETVDSIYDRFCRQFGGRVADLLKEIRYRRESLTPPVRTKRVLKMRIA